MCIQSLEVRIATQSRTLHCTVLPVHLTRTSQCKPYWYRRLAAESGQRWTSRSTQSRCTARYYTVGCSSRAASPLEALEVLVALKLLYGEEPGDGRTNVKVASTSTDNRGNRSEMNFLLTKHCNVELSQQDGEARMRAVPLKNQQATKEKTSVSFSR